MSIGWVMDEGDERNSDGGPNLDDPRVVDAILIGAGLDPERIRRETPVLIGALSEAADLRIQNAELLAALEGARVFIDLSHTWASDELAAQLLPLVKQVHAAIAQAKARQ